MKYTLIIACIVLLFSSCANTHQYRTLVIFDDSKPLGEMANQYPQLLTSDFQYKVGDTLRGLVKNQVVMCELK